MTDWKKTTLGQVAQVFTGFPFKSNDYSEDPHDIKLLRGDNIAQGTLRWDDAKKWPKSEYEKYAQYQLKEDDVVLAMDRPWIGAGLKYSSVRKEDLPSLLVQRTARLRGSAELDIVYLKYIIASPWFSKYIQSINTGSLVPHISSKQIKDYPVNLPSVQQQKRLSSVLAAIDNKININNRINAELEAMAKMLYDYWFVQFDFPDANGKPYKTSGGKMEYNATLKREIPEGWVVCSINEILGKIPTSTKISSKDVMISGRYPVIDQSRDYICGFTDEKDAVIKPDCAHVVFGDHTRIVKLVNFCYARGADGTQVLFSNNKRMPVYLLYQVVSNIDLSNYGYARHYKFLKEEKVILPHESIAQKYQSFANACYERVRSNIFEGIELETFRDWVLPLLMNGQVSVK